MSLRQTPEAPCKGCEERELGCHSHCIAYKQWYAKYRDKKKQLKEDAGALAEEARRTHRMIWGNGGTKT